MSSLLHPLPRAGAAGARPLIAVLFAGMVMAFWATAAPGFPRDPERTLEKVLAQGRMTVAVAENRPWVIVRENQAPSGAEVKLVLGFAEQLEVAVDWRYMPAFEAMHALEQGEVDLAIGGFEQQDITAHGIAAPSYAYYRETLLVAMPEGDAPPRDLEGLAVRIPPGVVARKLVRDREGRPVSDAAARLVAVPRWRAQALGLVPTGIVLAERKHVFAVRTGENAWLFQLEQFLRSLTADVPALLAAES